MFDLPLPNAVVSTFASGVTVRPGTFASRMIHFAFSCTATPFTSERRFETVPPSACPLDVNAAAASDEPPAAWMITGSRWPGFA